MIGDGYMKHGLIVLLLIITLIGCGECMITNESKNSTESSREEKTDKGHRLTVTAGEESIKCVSLINSKDSKLENTKDIFKFAFKKDTLTDIKYIKINEKITLNFGDTLPDNVSIKDILLNSNGEYLYPDKLSVDVSLTKEDNNFSFLLQKNPMYLLSSEFSKTKKQFRGFKITATWGKKEYIYAFVIKSNAY